MSIFTESSKAVEVSDDEGCCRGGDVVVAVKTDASASVTLPAMKPFAITHQVCAREMKDAMMMSFQGLRDHLNSSTRFKKSSEFHGPNIKVKYECSGIFSGVPGLAAELVRERRPRSPEASC